MPAQQRQQNRPDPGQALELQKEAAVKAATLLDRYRGHLTGIAPAHIKAEAFVELALASVRRDQWLMQAMIANPASFITALRQCAALGHMPMKGVYSLVPFQNRKAPGGWEITGVEEWRGTVERIFRAGAVTSVHVEVGREHDHLRWQPSRMVLPEHEFDEFASPAERGPLKAVYAWARMVSGHPSSVVFLNRHEMARIRSLSKTATKEGANGGNFWGPEWPQEGPNTVAMWKKSALHRLEGLVPTSAAYREAISRAEAAGQGWPGVPDGPVTTPGATEAGSAEQVYEAELVGDGDGWPTTAQPPDGTS